MLNGLLVGRWMCVFSTLYDFFLLNESDIYSFLRLHQCNNFNVLLLLFSISLCFLFLSFSRFLILYFSVVRVIIYIWSGARTISNGVPYSNLPHIHRQKWLWALYTHTLTIYGKRCCFLPIFFIHFIFCTDEIRVYSFLSHRVLVVCSSHTILLLRCFWLYVCMYLHEFFFFLFSLHC